MNNKIFSEKKYGYFIALFGVALTVFLSIQTLIQEDSLKADWFLVFQVFIGVLLCLAPALVERIFRLRTSLFLKNMYWLFILLSIFLGTGLSFYSRFYYWDKMLHFSSAGLLVLLGLGVLSLLMPKFQHLSLITITLFGFLFAMTLGVFWEFYEFTFDGILGLNMQQFATSTGVNLIGRASLIDTMGDLFMNTAGAASFSFYCYAKVNADNHWLQALSFTPQKTKHKV